MYRNIAVCCVLFLALGGCGGQSAQQDTGGGSAGQEAGEQGSAQAEQPTGGSVIRQPQRTEAPAAPTPTTEEQTQTLPSGLKYVDLVEGDGPSPSQGDTVIVHYTGWLESGKKFDSSLDRGQPFSFILGRGQVIKGWDQGVATMHIGGIRKLIVPPDLGYGARDVGNGLIPANSTLIFEVELLGIR